MKKKLKIAVLFLIILSMIYVMISFILIKHYNSLIDNEEKRISEERKRIHEFELDNEYKYLISYSPYSYDFITITTYNIDLKEKTIKMFIEGHNYMPLKPSSKLLAWKEKKEEYENLKNTNLNPKIINLTDEQIRDLQKLFTKVISINKQIEDYNNEHPDMIRPYNESYPPTYLLSSITAQDVVMDNDEDRIAFLEIIGINTFYWT